MLECLLQQNPALKCDVEQLIHLIRIEWYGEISDEELIEYLKHRRKLRKCMEIANELKNYLQNNDWSFRFDDERGIFSLGLNIKSKLKNIRYTISVNEDSYVVYAAGLPLRKKRRNTFVRCLSWFTNPQCGLRQR